MSEWQPIETAPKDGTVILGRNDEWGTTKKCRYQNGEWRAVPMRYVISDAVFLPDPTEWQALTPTPPSP